MYKLRHKLCFSQGSTNFVFWTGNSCFSVMPALPSSTLTGIFESTLNYVFCLLGLLLPVITHKYQTRSSCILREVGAVRPWNISVTTNTTVGYPIAEGNNL
jgi:hypothetical protein